MVKLAISGDFGPARRPDGNWLRTPVYQVWLHLLGQLPPFPNASVAERDGVELSYTTLDQATACFRGLERPHGMEDNGDSVIVYVLGITGTVQYHARMTAPIRGVPVRQGTVLTVQARQNDSDHKVNGDLYATITKLELVRADATNPNLPARFGSRYRTQCW